MEVFNLMGLDINVDELDYDENGRLVDKNGREVIMDNDGNFSYAEPEKEPETVQETSNTDNNISSLGDVFEGSLDDIIESTSSNLGTDVVDMNYTGYSSDSEDTVLERESEADEDEINNPDYVSPEPVARVTSNDFIDDSGNIVVMSTNDSSSTFSSEVINYKNIAVPSRIRSGRNVEDLIKSIKSTGLLNPIVVAPLITDGKYVLIDGYRRLLACVSCGITDIPAVVNNKIKTTEVPVLEALYNRSKKYTMKDMVDYISYLEKEKGITNPVMIEYLLDLDSGEYSKLKDVLLDNDPEIVDKLLLGQMTIVQAFKALEKRRSKESKDEKDIKMASNVYSDTEKSGVNSIEDAGELGDEGSALTNEQIERIGTDLSRIDEEIEDKSLDEMVAESNDTPGFEPHKQKVGEREFIDPVIKKTVFARDNFTCKCCLEGGESYVDVMDFHHVLPVYLGGEDTPENGITLCVKCHRFVHLWSTGDLHLPKEKTEAELAELTEEDLFKYKAEQAKFKKIVYIGDKIRKGMAQRGMNREQYKKEHSNNGIGRRKPGVNAPQEKG